MEKGFKNITNLAQNPQSDRIRQIQHKLQQLPDIKTLHLKDQKISNALTKVSNIEKQSSELLNRKQSQLRQQRQWVKQLMREYEDSIMKQQISTRNRTSQINEISNRLTNLLKTQIQKSQQSEKKLMNYYQQKIDAMRIFLLKQIQKRKQYFLVLDRTLSERLPELQSEVNTKMHESEQILARIHNEVETETQTICRQIENGQTRQVAAFDQLMKMMGSVIGEVKEEISAEKINRQESKNKLVALFEDAERKFGH